MAFFPPLPASSLRASAALCSATDRDAPQVDTLVVISALAGRGGRMGEEQLSHGISVLSGLAQ